MNLKFLLPLLFVFSGISASADDFGYNNDNGLKRPPQSVDRTDPVNLAKLGVFFKVEVPEALGWGVNIDAPVMEFLSIGGEFSVTFDLADGGKPSEATVIRTDVSAKPRLVYNDRFETYAKVHLGPAFQIGGSGNAIGVDFALLPGFQFSMSEDIGMFSEIGFGITHFPKVSETRYAGVFRIGAFYSF